MRTDIGSDIPEYSTDALNTLHIFHDCDCIIYVEGEDDVVFWDGVCKCADLKKYKIEPVGGIEQLERKFEKVINERTNIIIACDSDYSLLLHDKPNHPQIIMTPCYSIENIMYCPNTLNTLINKLARTSLDYSGIILEWVNTFIESVYELLIFDIANIKFQKGTKVMGDSCSRFLKNSNSPFLSQEKINEFLNKIRNNFDSIEIKECIKLIETSPVSKYNLIRGHFLTNAVLNFISKQVKRKKLSISCEHLFTETVNACFLCQNNLCSQLSHICENMKHAFILVNSHGL